MCKPRARLVDIQVSLASQGRKFPKKEKKPIGNHSSFCEQSLHIVVEISTLSSLFYFNLCGLCHAAHPKIAKKNYAQHSRGRAANRAETRPQRPSQTTSFHDRSRSHSFVRTVKTQRLAGFPTFKLPHCPTLATQTSLSYLVTELFTCSQLRKFLPNFLR